MKAAFLFPGQGSQTIGMGKDLHANSSAAREVFEEVDEALHMPLSHLMFEGDMQELTRTENAQPAIMAVGMAAVRALESMTDKTVAEMVSAVAGHSLGEYTALCAAGVFSIGEAARLLRARGLAMARAAAATPGAMAAVLGLSMDAVRALTEEASTPASRVVVANDNCVGQVVISGADEAVERAIQLATKAGAKRALKLQVAGAFHSPYMQPAADEMRDILADTPLKAPTVPVVANVSAAFETDPTVIKSRLVEQVVGSVRWTESATMMVNAGFDTFIECGNGKVMTGLMKRLAPEATLLNVGDMASLEATAALF